MSTASRARRAALERASAFEAPGLALLQGLLMGRPLTVVLAGLVILAAGWPIADADWVANMPPVAVPGLIGLSFAAIGHAVGWPGWRVRLVSLPIGAMLVVSIGAGMVVGDGIGGQLAALVTELRDWLAAINGTELRSGQIEFALFLMTLFYLMGYVGGHLAVRRRFGWFLVGLAGIVVIVTLSNIAGARGPFIVALLATSTLLILHLSTARRHAGWQRRRMRAVPGVALSYVGFVFGFGLVIVMIAGALPTPGSTPFSGAQSWLGRHVVEAQDEFGRLFSGLPSRASFKTLVYGEQVSFGGNPNLTADRLFTVQGSANHYWQARTYTTYTGGGWNTQGARFVAMKDEVPNPDRRRIETVSAFRVDAATDSLFSSGEPVGFNLPAEKLVYPSAASEVLQVRFSDGREFFPTRRNMRYVSRGSVSIATPEELARAGTAYPRWVREGYLQLPASTPDRVRALAAGIVRGQPTQYDRALAIQTYLSQIPYELNIPAPPPGADGVDWFLFSLKKGYCDYYASAMVVMLRSIGIPARFVVGYTQGEYDPATGTYLVRERNYHAWPEAYFPGYGWVPFEPTPGNAVEFEGTPRETEVSPLPPSNGEILDEDLFSEGDEVVPVASPPASPFQLALAALAFSAVAGLILVWYRSWYRLSRLGRPAEIYAKTRLLATIVGFPPKPSQTPHEYGRFLASRMPRDAAAVLAISNAYAAARYGAGIGSMAATKEAERAWRSLRWGLLMRLLRSWRAEKPAERAAAGQA
ncbi:MAG: transglutaminase domain-containing protein [SAR202 cluster bacterium]|nr:transglutaminase domain-containing protein [SAR202 cluster bacterium]